MIKFQQMDLSRVSLSLPAKTEIIFEWKEIFQASKNTSEYSGLHLLQALQPFFCCSS